MAIIDQIIENKQTRVIGFIGGKGRNFLLNQVASELAHAGQKVIITNIEKDILPPSGKIIYHKDEKTLLSDIKKGIKTNPIVYVGTEIQDHFVRGLTLNGIRKLKSEHSQDYLLLLLGSEKKYSLLSNKDITKICKLNLLDQLIYCFQLDLIDQPLDHSKMGNALEIVEHFPQFKSDNLFSQDFIFNYLTSAENGAYRLFQQKWPTSLVFTDINNLLLENRSINLARDLLSKKIQKIYQSNLKDNSLKRIPHK